MAVLYGIDQAAQQVWGQEPDLVISGPNEGNDLGYMNNNSGTLGATMIALSRGIPAIVVSADQVTASDDQQSKLVAQTVVDIVAKLVETQPAGQPLLPAYTGLNVNTPKDMNHNLGYKYTDVGWNAGNMEVLFTGDLSENDDLVAYAAQAMLEKGYASSKFYLGLS
ncbi:5'/3'-nucleotidase SurE [Vibrio gangliei]|uniref:5'/3'-nucleotidase SurE n=1 Tax=Vibrio gangliei TaxID=2077090 RepID=UPI00222EFCEE|nr:5'/3'-nucleotidase SurE [Vibrio gangliei]